MAMRVVTTATNTRMLKSVGVMMPAWSPMLSRMSSINPRAFISEPSATDSRRGTFLSHATTVHETPLPRIDSRSIPTVTAHSFGLLTSPIWVFRPE
ncbi:hypothetical protein A5679_17535 [Mycobacterium scrofulaceum]|uniref:Uncharacterized protein n=1 Tax=Mycobacterium scrofulaceum TaxID=1783 RepID=A0A1A2VQ76_MYCSC|nr:hypothetical protein A5679_17535 [Mycobacterium scrofulaceum]